MPRYNWSKMRTEYVTTSLSQRALAEKYKVSFSQLAKICSKEGWVEKRKKHRSKTAARAEQKQAERQAEQMADQLEDIRKAGDNLAALIADVSGKAKETKRSKDKVDSKSIKNLTSALKDVLDVLRDVYELPNLRDQAKMDRGEGAKEVKVIFEGEVQPDAGKSGE